MKLLLSYLPSDLALYVFTEPGIVTGSAICSAEEAIPHKRYAHARHLAGPQKGLSAASGQQLNIWNLLAG